LGGVRARLFVFGFQVLFLQLLLIRYLAGHIWNLGYFPNLVLLAAFIGFGFGFLLHGRISERISTWLYGFLPAILLAFLLLILWLKPVGILGQEISQLSLGGEIYFLNRDAEQDAPWLQAAKFAFWFFGVVGIFFLLGQKMAKLFRLLRPLEAYSLDISGSLAGIALFIAISWFHVPAAWWFLVFAVSYWIAAGGEVRLPVRLASVAAACALALVTFLYDNPSVTDYRFGAHPQTHDIREQMRWKVTGGAEVSEYSEWSPYQRLTAVEFTGVYGRILANGIGHQEYDDRFLRAPYISAHERRLELGEEGFKNVLIIGAGSGTDVAAALHAGAERVDAVEIDPAIAEFGYRARAGLEPYHDPRVFLHVDDGRHYLFNTDRRYDMIILALTDSLVKVSSVSQLRLENYLYTQNAFRRAAELLEPGGWFVMYNAYRQGWLIDKLEQMMAEALPPGSDIIVEEITLPDQWGWRLLMGRTPYSTDQPLNDEPPVDHGLDPATEAIWVADRLRSPLLLPAASVLIFVATSISLAVPLDALLAFEPVPRFLLASALMFTPVFLANLIFSVLFRDRLDAELYFGWNLLGATIGGVLEYISIATGYQALGAVVIALYAAALLCAWRGLRTPEGIPGKSGTVPA